MEESYGEGVANHTGPESCMVVGNGRREALTGVGAGWVLSLEIISSRVPTASLLRLRIHYSLTFAAGKGVL
jgi:RNA-directed DNA polymerase